MANKNFNTRIQLKSDTEANWDKATNFIPLKGETIIYSADSTHPFSRLKVGDGVTVVSELPFVENESQIDIVNNLTTTEAGKVLDARQGKILKDEIDLKVDKIAGKGLSTEDYTTAEKAKLGVTNVAFGTCETAAATAEKAVTVSGNANWSLTAGAVICINFSYTNTAQNPTLNVNETGAKRVSYNNVQITTVYLNHAGYENRSLLYLYDGTQYVWLGQSYIDNTYTSAYVSTGAGTAAKIATCTGYGLLANSYLPVNFVITNTAQSALTLNVNGKGAKPIYINGAPSGASNYTLPAGSYLTFYDGTAYHFRTDGKLPGPVLTGVKGDAESSYRTGDVNLTAANIGLGNVDNTSDADKPISTATQTALNNKISTSLKGAASGVAELDENGKVPTSQLPSFVDDVVEYSSSSNFPLEGEAGKIYVDTLDNKTYRWSGSGYVEISPSLALGETSSTAYRGDRGKTAYDHASTKGSAFSSGLYKITTNSEGHVTGATAVTKSDITALGIPGSDTDNNTTYTLTQDSSDGHKLTFIGSDGTNATFTIPDNNTTDLSSMTGILGIENGGTGTSTKEGLISKAFGGDAKGTTTYPTEAGIYRLIGTNIFNNLNATDVKYGLLIIFRRGYCLHIVMSSVSPTHLYYGYSDGNVTEPTTWYKLITENDSIDAATVNGHTVAADVPANAVFTDTAYTSKPAASGGTDVSLVTTGEKYAWNSKLDNNSVIDIAHGGTGASDEQAMHTAVFNNTRVSSWSAYPTAAGIYRTTGTLWTGMPTESGVNPYGVLVIFGCGGYYMHLYADANKNLFYGETSSMTAPTTWYRTVRGVKGDAETAYRSGDVNLTPANLGASASISITSSSPTAQTLYNVLNKIQTFHTSTIYMNSATMQLISGNLISDEVHGTITRMGTADFRLMGSSVKMAEGKIYTCRFGLTASDITPTVCYSLNMTKLEDNSDIEQPGELVDG